jgi:hypothetical protein
LGYTYPELQKWLPAYKTNGVFDRVKYEAAIRTTIEQMYSTTGKSVTLLPGMENTAKKLMSACSEKACKYENFPPGLLELRENLLEQAVTIAGETVKAGANLLGEVGGALFGGGMGSKPHGGGTPKPFVDFSWESQDYICNILYDRFVSLQPVIYLLYTLTEVKLGTRRPPFYNPHLPRRRNYPRRHRSSWTTASPCR